ncbi:MAG: SO_0444 family Cu/Zn efflux transporter [Bdellovibrionota bacterium]
MAGFLAAWSVQVWEVILESGWWLLLGLGIAAVLRRAVPSSLIERHLQAPGLGSILKASAAGVPLPLCSCSVIPVAVALRRQGAGRGATASFLVSTPEIGVDSFLLSWGLLGYPIAVLRAVAAFVSAVVVGLLVERAPDDSLVKPVTADAGHCCCCEAGEQPEQAASHGLLHSFLDLLDDIAPSLTIGFLLSGLVATIVPVDFFTSLGLNRFLLMLLMLVVSIPTYVCASASTALVAALMARGLSVGPALVFLLAGPASNTATILVVRSELGRAAAVRYVLGIAVVTLLIGAVADSIMASEGAAIAAAHHHPDGYLSAIGGIACVALLLTSIYRRAHRKSQRQVKG